MITRCKGILHSWLYKLRTKLISHISGSGVRKLNDKWQVSI